MDRAIYDDEVRNVNTIDTGDTVDNIELKITISEADLKYITGMKLDSTDDGVMTRVFRSIKNASLETKIIKTSDTKD